MTRPYKIIIIVVCSYDYNKIQLQHIWPHVNVMKAIAYHLHTKVQWDHMRNDWVTKEYTSMHTHGVAGISCDCSCFIVTSTRSLQQQPLTVHNKNTLDIPC